MRDLLGPGTMMGYCTNVHPGTTYTQVLANLERYTLPIKEQVSPSETMGIGLWLNAQTARQLIEQKRIEELSDWLAQRGLIAFTLNGFPYGDFHQPLVKHRVYHPDWRDPKRLAYTLDLITILTGLIQRHDMEGSISTLPVGWRLAFSNHGDLELAVGNLRRVIDVLDQVEQKTGRLIHVDLEPEPGCVLQASGDVVDLFVNHLDRDGQPQRHRRYLRVCHDTCHSAVMFEAQTDALERYRQSQIQIGKVQVSAAIAVAFDDLDPNDRLDALTQLRRFSQDRYLHQTVIQTADRSGAVRTRFYEDLHQAMATCDHQHGPVGKWRVHYHVPLFVHQMGPLSTTHRQAIEGVAWTTRHHTTAHYEIETYTWNVLPEDHRPDHLISGIAQEMTWLIRNTQPLCQGMESGDP